MYNETSQLFQPWLTSILLICLIITACLFYFIFRKGPRVGQVVGAIACLIFSAVIYGGIISKLYVRIDAQGITVRYPPFHSQSQSLLWTNIKTAKVTRFDPLNDFGGWGDRNSSKYGKGYITEGNTGLFIVDKNGANLMITILDTLKAKQIIQRYQLSKN